MVNTHFRPADKGDVMRCIGTGHPCGQLERAFRPHGDLLDQIEIQAVFHELGGFRDFIHAFRRIKFTHQEAMVEPVHARAANIVRPRIRIHTAHVGTDKFFLRIQTEIMTAWQLELQHAASKRQGTFVQHLRFHACGFHALLECIQLAVFFHLKRDMVKTRLIARRQDQRVFIPLVPAFQIHIACGIGVYGF